jgi:hypothetical protein
MNTSEIRKKVAAYMEVGFTMAEAFEHIKDAMRPRTKRSGHKLAEIVGNNDKGTYSIMDKKFIYH